MTEEIIVLICFAAFKVSSHPNKQFRNVYSIIVFYELSLKSVSPKLSRKVSFPPPSAFSPHYFNSLILAYIIQLWQWLIHTKILKRLSEPLLDCGIWKTGSISGISTIFRQEKRCKSLCEHWDCALFNVMHLLLD